MNSTHQNKIFNIIIPLLNEENSIEHLLNSFSKFQIDGYDYNLIFVDDGSSDKTFNNIKKYSSRLKNHTSFIIKLSRNWGKEQAMISAIDLALKQNAIFSIFMDGDLQHPLSQIEKMIKSYNCGNKIVMNVKNIYLTSFFRKITNFIFYYIMNKFSKSHITPRLSDFCLLDNKILPELKNSFKYNSIFRATVFWLGFRREILSLDIEKRAAGNSHFKLNSLISLAVNTIVSYSSFPIKLMLFVGIFLFLLYFSLFILSFIFQFNLIFFLNILSYFSIVILMMFVSLTALYLGKILDLSSNRPIYIIDTIDKL